MLARREKRVATDSAVIPLVVIVLNLGGCSCKKIDVHPPQALCATPSELSRACAHVTGVVGVGVRRRHVRGSNLRDRGRSSDWLARRGHHGSGIVHEHIVLASGCGCGDCEVLSLVATPRVGVVVNSRVTGQLIGAREALRATRELAGMGLFTSMRADMASLVLETVEGAIA